MKTGKTVECFRCGLAGNFFQGINRIPNESSGVDWISSALSCACRDLYHLQYDVVAEIHAYNISSEKSICPTWSVVFCKVNVITPSHRAKPSEFQCRQRKVVSSRLVFVFFHKFCSYFYGPLFVGWHLGRPKFGNIWSY